MAEKLRIQTHIWFNTLIKCTVGLILRGKYDLHAENREILDSIKPPYVLLPTHSNLWDPFFLNYFVPHPIFFVTSDALFRNRFISYWIRQFGCIPKSQSIPDIETIRNVMAVVKRGDVLCIYPEGMQTWDGSTLPLNPNTARLVKLLKVPVVRVISHGAFSTCPRWSRNRRQGRVTLDFKLILTAEQVRASTTEAIDGVIQKELAYDEWEWLSRSNRYFNNFFGAHGMEKVLYGCPSCETMGTMRGALNVVRCRKCGYIARFNNKGRFVSGRPSDMPANLREWNARQRAILARKLLAAMAKPRGSDIPLMLNKVRAFTGYRVNPMKRHGEGVMTLHADRLVFSPEAADIERLVFPVDKIDGITILRKHIEFYFDRTLYRFRFLSKYGSSLKWHAAIGIVQEHRADQRKEVRSKAISIAEEIVTT